MILVRDIFHLKFGKAKDALNLFKEGVQIMTKNGSAPDRILTDLTGEYYTLVMETTYNNLSEYENSFRRETMPDEWRKWYNKFTELVVNGHREIFTIVPITENVKTPTEKAYTTAKY